MKTEFRLDQINIVAGRITLDIHVYPELYDTKRGLAISIRDNQDHDNLLRAIFVDFDGTVKIGPA